MQNNPNQEILDKLTKVCICKGISKATIKKQSVTELGQLQKCKNLPVQEAVLVVVNVAQKRYKN